MKKYISVSALFAVVLFACTKEKTESTNTPVTGHVANISWQDCAEFTDHGLTICLTGAKEGRCGCNEECIWEGAVDFTLHVTGAGIDTTITLTTNSNPVNLHDSVVIGGTTIKVSDGSGIDCNDYEKYEKYKAKVELSN